MKKHSKLPALISLKKKFIQILIHILFYNIVLQFILCCNIFDRMQLPAHPTGDKIIKEAIPFAQILWDYLHMNHQLAKSDCILALGSYDLRIADRAAEIYLEGWAPLLIISGGLGNITKEIWTESEADQFARIAMKKGVPQDAILIENKSTNTGQNIIFTKQLLKEKELDPQSFIVVQQPYTERRAYATCLQHWPDKQLTVTSQQIAFEKYATKKIPLERVISFMVGEVQRIKVYPEKGLQAYQEISDDAWNAYTRLIQLGFTKHLVKE